MSDCENCRYCQCSCQIRLEAASSLAELEKARADGAEYDALLLRAENQKLWEFIEMLVKSEKTR